jgi:hypothetical protein
VINDAVSVARSRIVALPADRSSLIDRIRRRPLLLIGSLGMAVTLGADDLVAFTQGSDASMVKLVLPPEIGDDRAVVAGNLPMRRCSTCRGGR